MNELETFQWTYKNIMKSSICFLKYTKVHLLFDLIRESMKAVQNDWNEPSDWNGNRPRNELNPVVLRIEKEYP